MRPKKFDVALCNEGLKIIDLNTGIVSRTIGQPNFMQACCDGVFIAALRKGAVSIYRARTGLMVTRMNAKGAINCSMVDGTMTLSYVGGRYTRFDVRTGQRQLGVIARLEEVVSRLRSASTV